MHTRCGKNTKKLKKSSSNTLATCSARNPAHHPEPVTRYFWLAKPARYLTSRVSHTVPPLLPEDARAQGCAGRTAGGGRRRNPILTMSPPLPLATGREQRRAPLPAGMRQRGGEAPAARRCRRQERRGRAGWAGSRGRMKSLVLAMLPPILSATGSEQRWRGSDGDALTRRRGLARRGDAEPDGVEGGSTDGAGGGRPPWSRENYARSSWTRQ
jgi:hypothetical protein